MLVEHVDDCKDAVVLVKTKRVRRCNRTYEYLVLVESVRINGKTTYRTLFLL